MLRVPLVASHGRTGYWLVLRVALSWSPSASAGLSQLLGHDLDDGPGAAILGGPPLLESAHDHDSAAPLRDWLAYSAWSRQTITVKNDASYSRRPLTATRNMARAMPPSV